MSTATCHYGVTRRGEYQPCEKPAIGERIDSDGTDPYPVCQRHFNKQKQPPLPWRDATFHRRNPMTGEPLEPRFGHWRPCREHEAHADAGYIVLSCSRCLHHSGTLADCAEHAEVQAA